MHIEAELDDIYTERLLRLQHRLQKPLAQFISAAIDSMLDQLTAEEIFESPLLYQSFEKSGLIRCI